jgi:hypothetical protein
VIEGWFVVVYFPDTPPAEELLVIGWFVGHLDQGGLESLFLLLDFVARLPQGCAAKPYERVSTAGIERR